MTGIVPKRGLRDHDIQLVRFLPQGNVDSSFNSPVFEFGAEPSSISIAFGFGMGRLLAAVVHGRSIPAGIMPCDPNRINRFRPVFGSHYAQL